MTHSAMLYHTLKLIKSQCSDFDLWIFVYTNNCQISEIIILNSFFLS